MGSNVTRSGCYHHPFLKWFPMRNTSRTLNRCALDTCFSMKFSCLLMLHKAYQLRRKIKIKKYYLLPGCFSQNFHKCRTKSIIHPPLPILGTLYGSILLWALPIWGFSLFSLETLTKQNFKDLLLLGWPKNGWLGLYYISICSFHPFNIINMTYVRAVMTNNQLSIQYFCQRVTCLVSM